MDLRANQRKNMKRGRKPGKGKKQKGKKSTLSRKKSKRQLLKAASKKAVDEEDVKSQQKEQQASARKRAKPKAEQPEEGCWPEGSEIKQWRVGEGKNWRYAVLEGQTYGCSNCRFIYGGCKACQKPGFRGKTAADVRAEDEAAWEDWGDWEPNEVQESEAKPRARNGKKPKKSKAGAKER